MSQMTKGSPRRGRPARSTWQASRVDALLPRWVTVGVVTVLLLVVVVPVGYLLLLSISPDTSIALGQVSLGRLQLRNYVDMWANAPLGSSIVHTVVIAGCSAAASVVFGLFAAYPLSRIDFRGRRAVLRLLIWTQTVPGTTLVLPLFVLVAYIQTAVGVHLIGGYLVVIVTYMAFGLPLSTWLLVVYLRSLPPQLEEAALVDGCSRFGAVCRIVAPIALPALVVAFVFAFLVGWNDVLFASVLTSPATRTLGVTLQIFASSENGLPMYGQLMAASVVSSVPVVALYLGLQRYLVRGLGAGAVTGV